LRRWAECRFAEDQLAGADGLCSWHNGHVDGMASIDSAGAVITPCEDGPLLVRGSFTLVTQDGQTIEPGRGTVALCRCGKSAIKPFCDGTHKVIGFRAATGRTEA
jgi:CDGSH-type Zn-finger protein